MPDLTATIDTAVGRISELVGADRIRRDVPLAPYTTFKIGGPADYFVKVRTADELEATIRAVRESYSDRGLTSSSGIEASAES